MLRHLKILLLSYIEIVKLLLIANSNRGTSESIGFSVSWSKSTGKAHAEVL